MKHEPWMNCFDAFVEEVDKISLQQYGLKYTEENGASGLRGSFGFGENPQEVVDDWATKYDLTRIDAFV